jgi:hypothetical protein
MKHRWLSLDIAEVSGYAVWRGNKLEYCGELSKKPRGKGKWQDVRHYPGQEEPELTEYRGEREAWQAVGLDPFHIDDPKYYVVEAVNAHFASAAISLSERQGRVVAYLELENYKKWIRVEPSKWRRGSAKDLPDGKWPKGRTEKKQAAQSLVSKLWNIDAGPDVADAVLIGRWFAGDERK